MSHDFKPPPQCSEAQGREQDGLQEPGGGIHSVPHEVSLQYKRDYCCPETTGAKESY